MHDEASFIEAIYLFICLFLQLLYRTCKNAYKDLRFKMALYEGRS